MNTEIIISILIPMYNAAQTIQRCLDSLCMQYPQVFEILIIDDGSNDKSYEIVEYYSKQHTYIRLYKQSNQGVAKTRQNLIDYAYGKYILFCDADDYLEQDAVYTIYNLIHETMDKGLNVGMYIFGYNLIRKSGKRIIKRRFLPDGFFQKNEYSRQHIKGVPDLYWSALWNKCYRKDLCSKLEIQFEELLEDVMFNIDYISGCESIYISDKVLYNYVQIGESLTRSKKVDDEKSIFAALNAYNELYKKISKGYPKEEKIITECMYHYYKALYLRAEEKSNENICQLVRERYDEIQSSLGCKLYNVKLKAIIRQIENKLKNRLRDWLHQ